MMAGRLLQSNSSDRIVVDAYRMHGLKMTSQADISWPFEVVDISRQVYHFIRS
jgi:hypothetical protein